MLCSQHGNHDSWEPGRPSAAPVRTLVHENEASCEQSHAIGGLMVVQVLKAPSSPVRGFIHVARGIGNHFKKLLLLRLAQVVVQEVVGSGKAHQGVGERDFIPGSILHQPGEEEKPASEGHGAHSCHHTSVCLSLRAKGHNWRRNPGGLMTQNQLPSTLDQHQVECENYRISRLMFPAISRCWEFLHLYLICPLAER